MLSQIEFTHGAAPGAPNTKLSLGPSVTIFVGPNNSGKSLGLRELTKAITDGSPHSVSSTLIKTVTFHALSSAEATAFIASRSEEKSASPDWLRNEAQHVHFKVDSGYYPASKSALWKTFTSPNDHRGEFIRLYGNAKTLSLDGLKRTQLLDPQDRGDLRYPTQTFAKIFTNDAARAKVRSLIKAATGFHVAFDVSVGHQIHARFGDQEPTNERSLDDAALDYMRRARTTNDVSDGVKAFSGILIQLYAGQPQVIIVDEPEAFLHPSLAFSLGKELALGALHENKQVFAATHSPQFLMGAISSGAPVNIARLTYRSGIGTTRLLPASELRILMQDPLLRSVGVLEGLFYENVVVCEANADRAFYQEINERLLASDDPRGIPHTLFLIADNKQTVARVIAPLRRLGIACAGVVDLDVVKDGGRDWTNHLRAINVPDGEYASYSAKRVAVLNALNTAATNGEFKRSGGIKLLSGSDTQMANNFISDLNKHGLFVVPRGEVEAWLPNLNVSRSKQKWLHDIFGKMGTDPNDACYIKPEPGDVWDFVGGIANWLRDEHRQGMPTEAMVPPEHALSAENGS